MNNNCNYFYNANSQKVCPSLCDENFKYKKKNNFRFCFATKILQQNRITIIILRNISSVITVYNILLSSFKLLQMIQKTYHRKLFLHFTIFFLNGFNRTDIPQLIHKQSKIVSKLLIISFHTNVTFTLRKVSNINLALRAKQFF